MTQTSNQQIPTGIELHSKSRLLAITFADGASFRLPCEYLRVFSPAREEASAERPVTGKEQVNIAAIEQQGQYAVRLVFDDGHDTGIYSWETLYQLGRNQEQNWAGYLERLQQAGYQRQAADGGKKQVTLLYFSYLVKHLRRESESVELPGSVETVTDLLQWLGRRKHEQAHLLVPEALRVTVNRQFAEPFTRLESGDEIGLVPSSPVAPAKPA